MEKIPANKISREELLTRDVYILFQENRRLKKELKRVEMDNELLKKANSDFSRLLGRFGQPPQDEEEEQETAEEIGEFIDLQRKAMGLSFSKMGDLFGLHGSTIENYVRGRGSLKRARIFAERIRDYRRKQNAKKSMAPTNQNQES
jgi:hypothetical protein